METKHPDEASSESAANDEKNEEVEGGIEYEAQVVEASHAKKPGAWLIGRTASTKAILS